MRVFMEGGVRRGFLYAGGILFGGLLYAGLLWLAVLGPLLAGFVSGLLASGSLRRGFNAGVFSGFTGFCFVVLMLLRLGLADVSGLGLLALLLVSWMFLLWNAVGILLSGVGGVVGAM
jgi:hypothetical protein